MRTVGRWFVERRLIVVAAWLVALVALTAVKSSAGTSYRDSFKLSGTQSFDAQNLLQSAAPKAAGDSEQVVIAARHGTVRDPQVRARIQPMLQRLAALPDVASVISPYGPHGAAQISRDGLGAFAQVKMTEPAIHVTTTEANQFVNTARAAAG